MGISCSDFCSIVTFLVEVYILCVDINANARIKLCYKVSGENAARAEQLKKSGKVLATSEGVLVGFFTITTVVVESGVWMLASGRLTGNAVVMTPFSLISEGDLMLSCILLVSAIAFQIIALVLAFVRRGQLMKRIHSFILIGY